MVSSLPETDKPLYFGLPANIDRSRQRTVSSQVIKQCYHYVNGWLLVVRLLAS